jgi:hypothetical protein
MESDTKSEVLLLTDQAGTYYAIPVSELAVYQVTGESKGEIEQILGADVQGYGWRDNFVLASPMVDPSSIFGGGQKQGVGIDDPSFDPSAFAQAARVANTVITFMGMILNFDSAVSMPDIVKMVD